MYISTFLMQSLNEYIELKCGSQFQDNIVSHYVALFKLDIKKNKKKAKKKKTRLFTNVIGHCKRNDVIDVVPLFEDTLYLNSVFACKCHHLLCVTLNKSHYHSS